MEEILNNNKTTCMFYKWEIALNVMKSIMKSNPSESYSVDVFSQVLGVSPKTIILHEDGHNLTLENVMVLFSKKSNEYNCILKNGKACLVKTAQPCVNVSAAEAEEHNNIRQKDEENVEEPKKDEKTETNNEDKKDLIKELKSYRAEVSRRLKLTAYCVYSNKAIDSIVECLPTTMEQLVCVRGFGKATAEKYGDAVLSIVNKFLSNHPEIKPNPEKLVKKKESKRKENALKYEEQINIIRSFIGLKDDWVNISDIEKVLGLEKRGRLDSSDNLSTVAHLINRFLKSEGYITKRVNYDDGYDIFVAPPKLSKEDVVKDEDNEYYDRIVELIEEGRNIFVTGNAGTGKSYILNKLKNKYKKKLELTSTTGLAAVNIKGVTIHSWAGVGICQKEISKCVSDILKRKTQAGKIIRCEMLAIDEISMMQGSNFEYIDKVLRQVRGIDEPFGGIQLLLFGDFFQLPPVEENETGKDFCFETETWRELNIETVMLKTIYRQKEKSFIKALNDIRVDNIDSDDIALLKSREIDYDTSDTNMLHIFSRNDETENYNSRRFNSLNSKVYTYNAIEGVYRGKEFVEVGLTEHEQITMEIFKKNCRVNESIQLKVGCRVMLLINLDFERGLINGSCGEVVYLDEDMITVLFDNGVETNIEQHKFESYYNDVLQASITQYPLKLAYAITIHKSQGMTLENVVVDCNRIFEEGQTYVALSRVKSLDGLYLKGFSADKIRVNPKVVEFYKDVDC